MSESSRNIGMPPAARTVMGQKLTQVSSQEHPLVLQTCEHCLAVQYPPREVCRECLSHQIAWRPVEIGGTLMSRVALAHSLNDFFQRRLPWVIGSIKLDCGPLVMAHIANDLDKSGLRAKVFAHADVSGTAVLVAVSEAAEVNTIAQRMQHMQALQLLD